MSKKSNAQKRKRNESVNPQGLTEDTADQHPSSQPEQRAKHSNRKG
ncbi:hypothetical protein LCM20_13955 [Halobacillus litoralis]|nr:hypothetical protein [Halobacillus litoralis]MCA0971706.1 hypothetical protein [Halobacillus litoralis]